MLSQTNPGNGELRRALAGMLLDTNQTQKAYAVLEKMAADSNTRGDAADLWMAEINRIPVGEQSVAALQRYLVIFAQDPSTVEARKKLDDQQNYSPIPLLLPVHAAWRWLTPEKAGWRSLSCRRHWHQAQMIPTC